MDVSLQWMIVYYISSSQCRSGTVEVWNVEAQSKESSFSIANPGFCRLALLDKCDGGRLLVFFHCSTDYWSARFSALVDTRVRNTRERASCEGLPQPAFSFLFVNFPLGLTSDCFAVADSNHGKVSSENRAL